MQPEQGGTQRSVANSSSISTSNRVCRTATVFRSLLAAWVVCFIVSIQKSSKFLEQYTVLKDKGRISKETAEAVGAQTSRCSLLPEEGQGEDRDFGII